MDSFGGHYPTYHRDKVTSPRSHRQSQESNPGLSSPKVYAPNLLLTLDLTDGGLPCFSYGFTCTIIVGLSPILQP